MSFDIDVLTPDDLREAHDLFGAAIHRAPVRDAAWARTVDSYGAGRTFGVREGASLVATAMSFPSEMAVPGGAVLPMAAVTRVAVRADRTRRGLLSAMMRAQLDDVAERGEPIAALRASEARIYERFGYGVATRVHEVRVRSDRAGFRPGAPQGGEVRMLERAQILPVLREVYEGLALRRAGTMTRPDSWWDTRYGRRIDVDREYALAAVHTGPAGDDGFVLAFLADGGEHGDPRLEVADLHAADVDAAAGLWRFLLGVDLFAAVHAQLRPLDEPVDLLLADPRRREVTEESDEIWLRIVDVPTALAARSYGTAEPLLLAVHDPVRTGNAGVYRIADGAAERVGPLGGPVRPELECDVAALAMAYLGDRRPSQLVATGWWRAPDPTAVRRADAAFATAEVPWCGTSF